MFDPGKEYFVSKPESIESPLEICKRLYFEGVQFEVCTTKRIQTIPNDFRIDYEYGDVVLYLRGAQKYTLYSKSFDSFVKIIEPSGNSEPLGYYYLKQNVDHYQEGDETQISSSGGSYYKIMPEYAGEIYKSSFRVRRKFKKIQLLKIFSIFAQKNYGYKRISIVSQPNLLKWSFWR